MAIYIAVIIAVGLLFIQIPNVEMITATIFTAGYLLGAKKGLLVALSGELIFSLLNPFGAPNPPLLLAQLISMGLVGYAGSLLYRMNKYVPSFFTRSLQLGIAGFILTLIYDLLTTFSFAIILAETPTQIFATTLSGLVMGLPFTFIHLAGNTLIFAIIIPILLNALQKIDYFKPRLSAVMLMLAVFFLSSLPTGHANTRGVVTESDRRFHISYPTRQDDCAVESIYEFDSALVIEKIEPYVHDAPVDASMGTIRKLDSALSSRSTAGSARALIADSRPASAVEMYLGVAMSAIQDTVGISTDTTFYDSLQSPFERSTEDSTMSGGDIAAKKKSRIKLRIFEHDTTMAELHRRTAITCTHQSIQHQIYQNMSDILNLLPGFYSPRLNRPGESVDVYRHGLTGAYVDFMYDGRPLKDPITGIYNLNLVPIEGLEKIVIPCGSGTALVDNPIKLHSEGFGDNEPYSRVYFHIGPSEFSDTDVAFGRRVSNKADAMFGVTLKGNDGPLRPESYEHHQGRAFIRFAQSERWHWHYSWMYNRLKYHAIGMKLDTGRYATPDGRSLIYRNDHTLTLQGSVFNAHYRNFISKLYFSRETVKYSDDGYDIKYDEDANYIGFSSQLEQQYRNLKYNLFTRVEHDWVRAYAFGEKKNTLYTVGLDGCWSFADHVYLNTMIGSDGRSDLDQTIKYHFSLDWLPTPRYRLSSGLKRYPRYPSLYELHALDRELAHTELTAERIDHVYVALTAKPFDALVLETTAFMNRIVDPIDLISVDNASIAYRNLEERRYTGLDVHVKFDFCKDFFIGSVLNYVDRDDEKISVIPKLKINSHLAYENTFFNGDLVTHVRVEGVFLNERWGIFSQSPYGHDVSVINLPNDYILNIVGFFRILKAFEGYLSFENILRRDYQYIPGYPMPDQVFHYGLRWEFWD